MATLTIRGIDPVTYARVRVEAARHGRSMEAEARAILQERLKVRSGERSLAGEGRRAAGVSWPGQRVTRLPQQMSAYRSGPAGGSGAPGPPG